MIFSAISHGTLVTLNSQSQGGEHPSPKQPISARKKRDKRQTSPKANCKTAKL